MKKLQVCAIALIALAGLTSMAAHAAPQASPEPQKFILGLTYLPKFPIKADRFISDPETGKQIPLVVGQGICADNPDGSSSITLDHLFVPTESAKKIKDLATKQGKEENLPKAIELLLGSRLRSGEPKRNFDILASTIDFKETKLLKKEWDITVSSDVVLNAITKAQAVIKSPETVTDTTILEFKDLPQGLGVVKADTACTDI